MQTQCSTRGTPVIESLVFKGGQTLVRITAPLDEVTHRPDGKRPLEVQHADLIRKIRHGMLRDDETTTAPPDEDTHSERRRIVVRIRLPF